jgi:TonB-dependent starch-binding outer membrane protein SusC
MKIYNKIIIRVIVSLFLVGLPLTLSVAGESNWLDEIKLVGQVIDANTNSPIVGVNIQIKGANRGVISDLNGNFEFSSIDSDAVILVSNIGYFTQEISINGQTQIRILLVPRVDQLNELVVVGYGTQLERSVTGALYQRTITDVEETSASTFTDVLVGRIPGVQISKVTGQPGADASIRIRGTGSITAGNEPLYVIDGFPVGSGGIDNVNSNDIESVTILKDAAATAIYGSRGSNGVILVTTKRGNTGRPQISFQSSLGYQQVSKKVDVLSPQEYAELKIESSNNGWVYLGGNANDPNSARAPFYRNSPYLFDESSWPIIDWQDEIFQIAPVRNNELSVSGGDQSTQYRLSIGYFDQQGLIKSTEYDRFSIRSNVDSKINSRLQLSLNLNYTDINENLISDEGAWNIGVLGTALGLPGFFLPRNEDGSYADHRGFGFGVSAVRNPMININEENDQVNRSRTLGNIALNYELLSNLFLKTTFNVDRSNYTRNFFRNQSEFGNPMIIGHGSGIYQSAGAYNSSIVSSWLSENTANYSTNIGTSHNISVLAGFTAQSASIESASINANNFPNNLVPTLNAGDITGASTRKEEWSLMSYLGRINYDYQNKYFSSFTIRSDGSSRFGQNRKWGLFPSISAGWMISEENFMSGVEQINFMKVRASYGFSGNDAIPNYGSVGLLGGVDYVIGNNPVTGLAQSTVSNANLSWETSEQVDLGFDLGLLEDRINLSVDVYEKINRDLLLNVNVPSIMGFTSALQNIGKVQNRGLEVALTTRNTRGVVNWTSNFNISFNRNKVLALGPEGDPIISSTYGTTTHITQVGRPIGEFYGYIWDGIFNSMEEIQSMPSQPTDRPGFPIIRDVNGDGIINADDRTVIGNNHPDYVFGIENSVQYKNFDLKVLVQGVQGIDIMNIGKRQTMIMTMRTNQLGEARDRWVSPEQPGNGKVPLAIIDIYGLRRETSTFYVEDGSFVRVRFITLGYNLPTNMLSRTGLSNARVYFTAENPFTFAKNTGYNPEISTYNNALTPGTDTYNYPVAKTLTMGVNLSF